MLLRMPHAGAPGVCLCLVRGVLLRVCACVRARRVV